MIGFIRGLVISTMIRPAVVLTTVGSMTSFGATFHDLRGELPVTREYQNRSIDKIDGVIYHHSATTGKSIRSIAEFHTEMNKWPGIGYHYAIGYDGVTYILNGPEKISYHSQGYNEKHLGVVLIGNYHKTYMSQDMTDSFIMMNEYLKDEFALDHAWYHGETKATACPGKYAIETIKPYLYGPRPEKR